MVYAMKVKELTGSDEWIDTMMYETIIQTYKDDDDPRVEYKAMGTLVGWDGTTDNGIIRYIQDPVFTVMMSLVRCMSLRVKHPL